MKRSGALDDVRIHVRFKLAALWTSVMFLSIYGDYFALYQPGLLHDLLRGSIPAFGKVNQPLLLGISAMIVVPSVMIFLSVALNPKINRGLNIVVGSSYTLGVIATLPGSWAYWILKGAFEIVLTSLVVWYAWRWPRSRTV